MTEKKENILIVVACMIIQYLAIAFITLEFNPLKWEVGVRIFFALASLPISWWILCIFRLVK